MRRSVVLSLYGLLGAAILLAILSLLLGLWREPGPLENMGRPTVLLSGTTHADVEPMQLPTGETVTVISADLEGSATGLASVRYCSSAAGFPAQRREAKNVWAHFMGLSADPGVERGLASAVDCHWALLWSRPLTFATMPDVESPYFFTPDAEGQWEMLE